MSRNPSDLDKNIVSFSRKTIKKFRRWEKGFEDEFLQRAECGFVDAPAGKFFLNGGLPGSGAEFLNSAQSTGAGEPPSKKFKTSPPSPSSFTSIE